MRTYLLEYLSNANEFPRGRGFLSQNKLERNSTKLVRKSQRRDVERMIDRRYVITGRNSRKNKHNYREHFSFTLGD